MFVKILLSICFVGVSQAVFINHAENHTKDVNKDNPHGWQMIRMYHPPNSQAFGYKIEPYAYPKYEFEYSVSDQKTGDHKHHKEARDGDRVRGEYSLVESDGSLRKVQYHADDHNGFNAVVSKTVNKHGDHAVSVTDHTRFFYPVGHGIKINHYFPGKNYHYQNTEKSVNNLDSIPVYEEKESATVKNEEAKMLVVDSGDNFILTQPEQVKEAKEEEPAPKSVEVEAVTVKVVPALVSINAPNSDSETENTENVLPVVEKTENVASKDLHTTVDDQPIEKKDKQMDSEVASSFYHSKFYYVGF